MKVVFAVFALLLCGRSAAEKLEPQTLAAWNTYLASAEARIAAELGAPGSKPGDRFLAADFLTAADSRQARDTRASGGVYIRRISPGEGAREIKVPDGLIHHWLGTIFLPGADLPTILGWVQKYDDHHKYFEEVERSKLVSRSGDRFEIYLRFKRKKIITAHYNTHHAVAYRLHDATHASSRSAATRIAEIADAGEAGEREKAIGDDSGFLWRLNSYWRFHEANGGVYLECESISLSRGIPAAVAWMIRGFVTSVPRESLERTLESIRRSYRN